MNDMSGTPREDLHDAQTSAGPAISAAGAPAKKAPSQAYANITEREKAYEDFWKALRELLGESLFVPALKYQKAHQISAQAVLAGTQLDVLRDENNAARVVVLQDLAKKSSIGVLQDRVAYQSRNPKKDFTMEDAMKMAWLAAQNKDLLEKGINLEGSAKHKRMLQLAIQAVNETMPPEQRLEIKNPVRTYLMAKPDFRAFVAANSGDAPAQAAPEQAQAFPDEVAAPAPAAPTADKKAPVEQDMAKATVTAQPYFFNTSSIDAIAAGVEKALETEGYNKSTSKDRKVDKTGAFPFYTVYKVPMELDETSSGAAYYVMKNKKPHLIGLDVNGQSVMRDADIFMQKDINHPKNLAQAQEKSPVSFSLSDIVNASVDRITYGGEFPTTPAAAPTKAPSGVESLVAKMMKKAEEGQEIQSKPKPLILGLSEGTRRIGPSPS